MFLYSLMVEGATLSASAISLTDFPAPESLRNSALSKGAFKSDSRKRWELNPGPAYSLVERSISQALSDLCIAQALVE